VEVIHGKTLMIKCMKTLHAHTGTVYTIDVDPTGRYFATGGSDALVNIWDIQELICIRSLSNSEYGFHFTCSYLFPLIQDYNTEIAHDLLILITMESFLSVPQIPRYALYDVIH